MSARRELFRITASLTGACALGAAVLGVVFVATERYERAARVRTERTAIASLLGLDSSATVQTLQQFLAPARSRVVYRVHAFGDEHGAALRLVFSLEGELLEREVERPEAAAGVGRGEARERLVPLGRLHVARGPGERGGEAPLGFVVEGSARGYKNRIRYLVGLTPGFELTGVRVVEHEEDPGLGAEIATRAFEGQFIARPAATLEALDVTRDPMPEDWRAVLAQLSRVPVPEWRGRNEPLLARERTRPIYAVTGATISSRALTDGVRVTVDHFRRRWALLARHLGDRS